MKTNHTFKGTVDSAEDGLVGVLIADPYRGSYPPIGTELRVYYDTPRFVPERIHTDAWCVQDMGGNTRYAPPGWVARFNGEGAEQYARKHAALLNAKDAA